MTAPQSASETDTQPGPNSDDLNTAAPFPFLIINFLASYYKIGQQDGRMLMHAARVYDLKDSEALRWAKVVQQAENFCHNRNGEHKWHWAKDKADDFLIRAYEAWPDLKMHERLCRGKMALGGVATFFQYTGTQTEAQTALEDFIRTGIIPAPKPVPEATKEAMRLEGIAKRSAELETGEAELDKWFGPKKVSKAVTDSSNGKILGDYLKTQQSWGAWWTSAKNLCKANGIEDDKAQEAHIHEILLGPDYGDRSAKTYPGTPGDALGAVKDSFATKKTIASEISAKQPASAPVASTPVTEPAKVNRPVPAQHSHSTNGNPFQKASKKNSKLRMVIGGVPGGGKTYTALQTARALYPDGKIALIDTERGSAEKYADLFDFDVLSLDGNYSPERYIEMIHAAESHGYDLLIIDSLSHEWDGDGGVLDSIDDIKNKLSNPNDTWSAWREMTPRHNALIAAILEAKLHVIVTMRCKWKNVVEKIEVPTDKGGSKFEKVNKKVIGNLVQRDKIEYEFDIVTLVDEHQNLKVDKSRCPALTDYKGRRCGDEMANKIAAWLNIEQPTPAAIRAA